MDSVTRLLAVGLGTLLLAIATILGALFCASGTRWLGRRDGLEDALGGGVCLASLALAAYLFSLLA